MIKVIRLISRIIFFSRSIFVITILFSGCGNPDASTTSTGSGQASSATGNDTKKDSALSHSVYTNDCKSLFITAQKLDSVIMTATEANAVIGNKAIKAFTDFSFYCKNDSLAPIFLIKAAQIAQSINNLPQAQICLEKCINDFPDFKNRGAAMFLLAQLYDEVKYLNNEQKAEELYASIISLYPRTEWAANAKAARNLLGKTDEEIVKEFTKKNKK